MTQTTMTQRASVSNLRKSWNEKNAEYAASVTQKLFSAEVPDYQLTETELAGIYGTCLASERVLELVGMYLVGSYDRAESNLAKLKTELRRVFHLPEPELITEPESELF